MMMIMIVVIIVVVVVEVVIGIVIGIPTIYRVINLMTVVTVEVSMPQTSALEYGFMLLLPFVALVTGVLVLVAVLILGVPSNNNQISYKKCDSSVINQSYVNDTVSLASS
jgi:hypothetical protein